MRRVMIVGGSGAGKSTFAQEVGRRTGLPVVHLDALYWEAGWREPDEARFRQRVSAAVATEAWAMDGNYSRTWPTRLSRADTVVFLDIATPLRLWRVVRRSIRWRGRTRPDLAPDCPEQLPDRAFLRWIVGYSRRGRPKAIDLLAESRHRGLSGHHLRGPREARAFLDRL